MKKIEWDNIYILIVAMSCLIVFIVVVFYGSHDEIRYTGIVKSVDVFGEYHTEFLVVFEDGRKHTFLYSNLPRKPFVGDVMVEIANKNWLGWHFETEWKIEEVK